MSHVQLLGELMRRLVLRPAHEMQQIAGAIIEQLTVMPGIDVTLRLEIDAEVPSGIDRGKIRTLMENANILGFIDKSVR